MDLVGFVSDAITLHQFILDIRLTGGSHQGRHPIQQRDKVIRGSAGFNVSWPLDQHRYTEAAVPSCVLFTMERNHSAVRPQQWLSSVVGGVDHYRVVRDAELVQLG